MAVSLDTISSRTHVTNAPITAHCVLLAHLVRIAQVVTIWLEALVLFVTHHVFSALGLQFAKAVLQDTT